MGFQHYRYIATNNYISGKAHGASGWYTGQQKTVFSRITIAVATVTAVVGYVIGGYSKTWVEDNPRKPGAPTYGDVREFENVSSPHYLRDPYSVPSIGS